MEFRAAAKWVGCAKTANSHPSLPANPDIAHYLYSRGYMERIGRGTLKMIQACQEEGIHTPKWEVDSDGVKLTLYSRVSRLTSTVQFNERQQAFLDSLGNGMAVSLNDYRKAFALEVSERQARRDLSKLVDADFLRQEGKGSSTQYIRTKRKPGKL
ncbi:MAG: hypothetical protein EOO61_06910 [Hymenobacter sp.]|nr:MAG: hypothetical protein EOO61_06910 [Hymenobacter sp.]